MLFLINKRSNKNGTISVLLMNEKGRKQLVTENEYNNIKDKICYFYPDRVSLFNENICIKESYTILGKFYKGRKNDVFYLVSDPYGNLLKLARHTILTSNYVYSNANVGNNLIKFKSGSIPFLGTLKKNISKSTITKLSNTIKGTSGSIGVNRKFIGKRNIDDRIGIVKFPLGSQSYDCINEVVCYHLGILFGFDVAEASIETYNDRFCVISCYKNNNLLLNNTIKSLKSSIDVDNFRSLFNLKWLEETFSKNTVKKFIQMLMFDYITRQEDRHISNIAFYENDLYSLYDNGRSLYFSDEEYKIAVNTLDLDLHSSLIDTFVDNEHGYGMLFLEDIIGINTYKNYINNNVSFESILEIFIKYYPDKDRAKWTAKYVYRIYSILLHKF